MDFSDVGPSEEAEGQRLLLTAFETAPVGDGLAGRAAFGGELLRSVRQRSRRARRMRALVPAGALLAACGAGALAVTMTASVTAGPVPARSSAASGASAKPSALAVLTAAVTKTSAQSYAFTTVTTTKQTASLGPGIPSVKITGTFDPTNVTGEEWMSLFGPGRYGDTGQTPDTASMGIGVESTVGNAPGQELLEALTPGSQTEVIFGDGHMYAQTGPQAQGLNGKPWLEAPLPSTARPSSWDALAYNGDEPIAPSGLLGLIKSAVSLTNEGSASGPGWTGTKYGFTVRPEEEPQGIHSTVTYTIEVDSQGLVRDVRSTATAVFRSTGKATGNCDCSTPQPDATPNGRVVVTEDTTYGGFGTPVSVTPPPASEIYNFGTQYASVAVY